MNGVVYLLHFHRRFDPNNRGGGRGTAMHYLGWASDLARRLEYHGTANGANLMWHVRKAGITWETARTWEGVTRTFEAQCKKQGSLARLCPLCTPNPREVRLREAA